MKKPLHEKLPNQDVRLHYIINHKAISFHWHEEIEILYFEKGKAQLYIDEKPVLAEAGDIIIINPLETHRGVFLTDEAKHHIFHISTKQFDTMMDGSLLTFEGRVTDNEARALFKKMILANEGKDPWYMLEVKARAFDLLSYLVKNHACVVQRISGYQSEKKRFLNGILQYIEEHIDDPFTVAGLASIFFVTPSYLSHLFAEYMGQGVIAYVNKCKIEKAKHLLLSGEWNVGEVAASLGITDLNYFSRLFKKKTGVTPTAFMATKEKSK